MYTQKAYAAFGYVLVKNTYPANEVVEVTVDDASTATFFWTRGKFHSILKDTGEQVPDWEAGTFINPSDYIKGTFIQTPPVETVVWCYEPKTNRGYTPPLSKFELSDGGQSTLTLGTKLFLCEGALEINGNIIQSPTQILVKNGDKQAVARGQCYGILFG